MNNSDIIKHVKGESIFLDDMPVPEGTLYAGIFASSVAHGKIVKLDLSKAKNLNGIIRIFTYKDIPGENQIGNIIADESLLSEDIVEYIGEPIAVVVAESQLICKEAIKLIEIEYDELEAITDPREAFNKGSLITQPVTFSSGDVDKAFEDCDLVIEDSVDIGGQEHLYLETQGAVAIPVEGGGIILYSSTQGPTAVQRATSKVLGIPMNKIEVDVLRLGGGFGGKEDQATPWAAMAALAAYKLNKPVKLILNRHDDLYMTGKRHPYSADYKIGLTKDGKILAYEATFYQNAGACADLSTAVLERTLFHATNSYYIPNVKTTGISCKTNLPPNTAFRGFGGPQGMFVIESAIWKAANKLGVPPFEIQEKNLLKEGDHFYYGQKTEHTNAIRCWEKTKELYNLAEKIDAVNRFNSENKLHKKGISLMPICFGISFTSSFMNQASALVHIYTDGSVGISTAAVEMGQGVNEKIRTVAARTLSIDIDRIKIESTNTTRVANTSPTAASSAADLNGNAVLIACKQLRERLINFARQLQNASENDKIDIIEEAVYINGKTTENNWESLISKAYFNRVSLSQQAYYATPEIFFNRDKNKGKPFAYHVFGAAITTATIDCLRGTYVIDSVEVVHDFGKSLNPTVDLGQAEGAIVQGIGWLTIEELVQNSKGKLLSNSLSTYKIPDIYSAPNEIKVHFLEESENPFGPFNSKAIGEPPFMYGIGAYFALANAIKEFNNCDIKVHAPLTHEKVLLNLYDGKRQMHLIKELVDSNKA